MIVMNETIKGSPNGITVIEYQKDEIYKPSELGGLLEPWLARGVCSDADTRSENVQESIEIPVKRGRPKKGKR